MVIGVLYADRLALAVATTSTLRCRGADDHRRDTSGRTMSDGQGRKDRAGRVWFANGELARGRAADAGLTVCALSYRLDVTPPEPKQPPADPVLQALNEAFYFTEPAAYLRARLASVIRRPSATQGPDDDLDSLQNQVLRRLPGWAMEDRTDPEEAVSSETVEAFALAHQTGEVLLRHLIAQLQTVLQAGSSPWLALSALQEPKEFRDKCRRLARASEEELIAILAHVFLPHWAEVMEAVGEEEATAVQAYLAAWVRHFASFHLDHSNGYNAVKHGLSAVPQRGRISFYTDPETTGEPTVEIPMLDGRMLETLETRGRRQARRWVRVRRAVDAPGLLACAVIAISLLEWLWAVGLARHRGGPAELPCSLGPLPAEIRRGHELEWGQMTIPIAALPLTGEDAANTLRRLGVDQDDSLLNRG